MKEDDRLARNSFISSILHSVYQYKKYPIERDYCNLSSQIMKQFPAFFSSQVWLFVVVSFVIICITFKMLLLKLWEAKWRKFADLKVLAVYPLNLVRPSGSVAKSKDGKYPGQRKSQKEKMPLSFEVPAGEDDVSFQRHNRVLKTEYVKSRPNMHLVSELMNLTLRWGELIFLIILAMSILFLISIFADWYCKLYYYDYVLI